MSGLAVVALFGAFAPGQALPDVRLDAVERFVERSWSRLGLPGVAVSVAGSDSVLLALGYGRGPSDDLPITGSTPFYVGSVTKTVTAAVAARLAARGLLDLDAPVETYLPDFTLRPPFTPRSITVRHLLQHRSGLSQWNGHDRLAQSEGRFDHLAPTGPPGEETEYSSLNFMIVGRILEAASGRPYDRLVTEELFEPVGMTSAFVAGTGAVPSDLAPGHQGWFGLQLGRMEPPPPRFLTPAGFVGASAHDMGRYGGMLLGGGALGGARLIEPSAVAELLGPPDEAGRALAWGRRRIDGTLVLEHDGNTRTMSARVRLVPERGYAITVLAATNAGPFFGAPDALLDGIDSILRGEPAPRPWPAERLFEGAVLVGTVLAVVGMARRVRAWHRAGAPITLEPSAGALGRLAFDLAAGAAVLVGVPRLVGVPLPTMVEYFPDLGVALTVSAGAGMIEGLFRAFTGPGS